MTNGKIEISRELIERIVKDSAVSVAQLDQLRQTLAAPTVDRRQPDGAEEELIVSPEVFHEFETALENRPLKTNLAAQRLLRRHARWS